MGKIRAGLISGVWVLLLFVAVFGVVLTAPVVRAGGAIYIRIDGSIEPSTAPVSTIDNVTYILTGNITSDADGIVIERNNIIVDGNGYTIQATGAIPGPEGINLSGRENVTVRNTQIQTSWYGILLSYASNNSIVGNNITGNNGGYGIKVGDSSNNTIYGNKMANNEWGIVLYDSSDTTITGNNITNGWGGIWLSDSSNNTTTGNKIANNQIGIEFMNSSNNTIYHNNFIDNIGRQVYVYSYVSINVWDNGYPSGGNYWSDYAGVDADGDGIGDTPYVIDENNTDRYPLRSLWISSEHEPILGVQVGVKAGDWIKIDYTITGWPAGSPHPLWLKVEFLSVEGTNVTVRVTVHMSDGTDQNATVPVDVVAGGQAFGLSGFVVPANLTTGDIIYMSGYGNVTIAGETTSSYAGATRTVVQASFSQYGTQLTYYWDKLTGAMVEASVVSGGLAATGKATETNMWQAATSGPPIDPIYLYVLAALAIIIAVGAAAFIVRRKKKPSEKVES